MRSTFCWLLLLAPNAFSQTYVVDAANGPGTNFTSLPAAVAAVPDGAVLLVRPGSYTGFTLTGKGITVLGSNATIQGAIAIGGTAPHQGVTLRGLAWTTVPTGAVIALSSCQGATLLEDITMPVTPPQPPCTATACPAVATGILASACDRLYLRACSIRCTVELQSCDAVAESCFVSGEDYGAIYDNPYQPLGLGGNPARDALLATNSNVQVCGSSHCEGGDGDYVGAATFADGGSGIKVQGGSLRLLDGTLVGGLGAWVPSWNQSYAVEVVGSVQLRISPRVVLTANLGPQVGADVMPELTGASGTGGGTLTATATTENGDLVMLAVGLPGPALLLPRIQDPFWLDPNAHVCLTIATQQPGVPVSGTVTVPAGTAFEGLCLNWQAVCHGLLTGFQATNPVVTLVY